MTRPIGTSRGEGRYVAAERDLVLGTWATWSGERTPLIYCHGSGDTTDTAQNKAGQGPLIRALAQHFTVGVADLGLEAWGNDTHVTRIGQEKTHLANNWGADGPVVLVCTSMGALGGLAYTLANPANVAAVACVIPALDMADLYSVVDAGVKALIDAAYGGAYSDVTHGPTHSPIQYADELPADLPIAVWAADNDLAARPGPMNAFVTARPQTDLTWVGNLGHTEAAIAAASAGVVEFVTSYA